jgi:hypothetical protein
MFGMTVAEGLGVFLSGEGEDLCFFHPGSNAPGSECWVVGCPGKGKGVIIMDNGEMGSLLAMEIISAVSNLYEWPLYK